MGVVGWSRFASGAVLFWVFLGPLALLLGVHVSVFSDPTLLTCGQKSLQFTLSPGREWIASFVLTTWGEAISSGPYFLQKGRIAVGLICNVGSYAGCYVFEWDHNYLILVGLEGTDAAGQKVLCDGLLISGTPADLLFFPALDAPSSSVCSAVPSQDRLPCASLPISQGDCEARGCCYDPRERVKLCYFDSCPACLSLGLFWGMEQRLGKSPAEREGERLMPKASFPEVNVIEVYLHCSALVCHQSVKESCITACPSRVTGKRSAEHPFQEGTSHVSSKGPVIFLQDELRQDTAKDGLGKSVHATAPWALGFAAVATGTALCVVLVVSVLWQRKMSAMHETMDCNKLIVEP
ncbi:zona pellucida sperm-binding protein 4-like, partial [Onychostruthus taczanowskii]|uniref:zona pellucida sperm-binding protein 4-like n=1 Tax=Onychostruthus taczanowskii TaxID=356909 RepID=UPI001B803664